MSDKLIKISLIFFLSLIFFSSIFPQTQTGSINGTIQDNEGNPLPGVTVTVTSEALMGTQTYVSTEAGSYRFPALPPGTYTITAELPGFKKFIRGNIIVRVGMVNTIDFTMEMSSIAEEVTVTAPSPAVDVKQTKVAISVSKEIIENIPISRDLSDMIRTVPGAINTTGNAISIHGTSTRGDSYFSFDGANMFDPVNGTTMNTINVDSVEEMEIATAAMPAEVGFAEGGYINVVTRSGGNKFSGSALIYYTNENLAKSLWTDEGVSALGVKQPSVDKSSLDGSLSLGGPIVKDKLWFFSSLRYTDVVRSSAFIPFTDILGRQHAGVDWKQKQMFGYIKLSSQITSKLKFMGLFNYLKLDAPGGTSGAYGTFVSSTDNDKWEHTVNSVLSYVLNQNTFFDFRFTFGRNFNSTLIQKEVNDLPQINDSGTPYGNITGRRYDETYLRRRLQAGITFTRFQDNLLGGNHEFKGGAEWEHSIFRYDTWRKNSMLWYFRNGPYYYNAADRYGRITFLFHPTNEGTSVLPDDVKRLSFFLQDSVVYGRLSINFGIRYDHFNGWVPAWDKAPASNPLAVWVGENVVRPLVKAQYPQTFPNGLNPFAEQTFPEWSGILNWNTFTPRIGLTYDVFGNGKTALKAAYSQYSVYLIMEHYGGRHPFAPGRGLFDFYWTDTNANGQPDTADTFVPFPVDYRYWDLEFAKKAVDSKTKAPVNEEITVGVWQELFKDFSLGVTFLHKNEKNMLGQGLYDSDKGEFWYDPDSPAGKKYWIPFTVIIPGTDNYPNQTITMYARSKNAPTDFPRFINLPELKRKYWGLEFIFNKRMSNGWQFSGSVVYSKAYGNGFFEGQSNYFDSANKFINTYGRIVADRPLVIKLMGTVQLPFGFLLSSYFRHYSGAPWTRTVSVRPPQAWAQANNAYWTAGYYEAINLESLGSRREKAQDILDLRLEKEFGIGNIGRFGAYIDIFNILGWSTVNVGLLDLYRYTPSAENVAEPKNVTLSPAYKKISSVEGLRTVNLSLRFRF